MDPSQPFSFGPTQGSPASPFDDNASGSPFGDERSGPHSPASAAGSNSPMRSSMPAAAPPATSAVKAPWDDDDDDWNTPSAPAPTQKPAAPAAAFPPAPAPAAPQAPPAAAPAAAAAVPPPQLSIPSQDSMSPMPGSPAEPRPTPQSQPQPSVDDFIPSSPPQESPSQGSPQGSPNRPPTPPSAVNTAKMDALNKQIANRTAAFDAATREKESKILAAAQEYIKTQKAKREKEVAEAKASHKQEQQADANRIDAYKKSGAVWNAVGMLVDLQKPNQYSKGTEQMRSVLSILNTAPAAAAVTAKK